MSHLFYHLYIKSCLCKPPKILFGKTWYLYFYIYLHLYVDIARSISLHLTAWNILVPLGGFKELEWLGYNKLYLTPKHVKKWSPSLCSLRTTPWRILVGPENKAAVTSSSHRFTYIDWRRVGQSRKNMPVINRSP